MKDKQALLTELQEALKAGTITDAEVRAMLAPEPVAPVPTVATQSPVQPAKPDKLSAVDVMFYVAGIVLFSAIMSVIVQSWSDGSAAVHILLSAGVGVGLWGLASYLIRSKVQSDIRSGLINSSLLTGSLSVITGGYIITNELIGGFDEVNYIPAAIMLAVLGAIHIAFDREIKRDLILLLGVLLCVAAFPALLFGILKDADAAIDIWCVVVIIAAGLLAAATRVVAKMNPDRHKIRTAFDSLAVFIALASMYVPIFGDYGVFWLVVLFAGVFGIFYLSIVSQSKQLLGNASFFLVLAVITAAFKYFSGYGVTTSLIVATIGLLGSAGVAAGINKKYFKSSNTASATPPQPQA